MDVRCNDNQVDERRCIGVDLHRLNGKCLLEFAKSLQVGHWVRDQGGLDRSIFDGQVSSNGARLEESDTSLSIF